MAVDDLTTAELDRAVKKAVKQCKFMPSGAELREMAREIPSMVASTDDYLARLFKGFEHRSATAIAAEDRKKLE